VTRRLAALCLGLALICAAAGPALWGVPQARAQETAEAIDYDSWERVATRAEEAVESARASTQAFDTLRAELVRWRDRFQAAQQANASTISTVRQQLDALGPPPEDGSEAPAIAKERAQLNDRLGELQAPVKKAELAFSRADGLIKGIDRIISQRKTEQLLSLGPAPLNPAHWGKGGTALLEATRALQSEVLTGWSNPAQRDRAQQGLPLAIFLLLVGGVLIARGRTWSRRLNRRVLAGQDSAGRWMAGFAVSLGSLVLPLAGVYAVIEAAYATGLVGLRSEAMLAALLRAAAVYLAARWLATRIFPVDDLRAPPLRLDADHRRGGRWCGASLGLVIAAYYLLRELGEVFDWSAAALNVIMAPVVLLAGVLMWRLGRLLALHMADQVEESGEETYRIRAARLLSRALMALAVVAPALAAVGYVTLAQFLLFPAVLSLLLLAALMILQRLVVELYVLVSGNREAATESLVPVLAGFVLVLVSLPFFALIWGARVADLTELWSRLMQGFEIGGARISPTIFLTFAVVFAFGFMATRLLQGALKNSVLPKTRIDVGGRNAIVSGVGYIGIFLAALVAITSAGLDLSSIAIVAGALSVGIGFGLQTIVSNFVSGIILLIERPISEGDWIEVGGVHGYVRDIAVRATRIETFDRTDVIVPNSDLISGRVTNYTRGNTVGRVIVPVGVAYGTDTRKVERILQEVAEAHPMVLMSVPPFIVFQGFGENSLDFEIRAILRDVNWVLNVQSDMNHEIARRFAEEGIEIPFPQRDVWLRNPEALSGQDDNADRLAAATAEASRTPAGAHLTSDDIDGDPDADADGAGDGR